MLSFIMGYRAVDTQLRTFQSFYTASINSGQFPERFLILHLG